MKRNKAAVLCALLAGVLMSGCASPGAETEQYSVALVAKSTETEFWLSVFAGAEAAATEYNIRLDITGPETEEDYEAQNRMIAEAVSAGAERSSSGSAGAGSGAGWSTGTTSTSL